MSSNIFDRLSFLALFLVVILLPLFCLPFANIPVEASKGLLLVAGLAVCIVFWAIARFLDGNIVFSKSWLLASGFFIALAFLLSALMSSPAQVSLFGTMFDIGSFWFIFAAFILMLMSSVVFKTPQKAKIVLLGAILSSAVVLVFQTAHLFMPSILSLGILSGKIGNVLGSWNSLGLFAGFSALMFLLVIEFFPISKLEKILLEVFILLAMFLIAAVNFPLVWTLLGISGLIIFVYKVSITFQMKEGEEEKKKAFPLVSLVVVIVSLLFFISGQFIGNILPNRLQISNTEVGPSLGATMSVTKGVLMKDPVFGIGPNRFGEAWSTYKPAVINNTQFWDISFDAGSGLLPTLTATTGGLGVISWVLFLVLFLVVGARSVFSSIKNGVNWEMMAFFVLSLYLFVSSFLYSTGTVIFLLALAFTGVFIGLASSDKEVSVSFLNDHRKSFFSILALIVLIILSVAATFKYMERFISVSYFSKALSAQTIPLAESNINKAISLYSNDLYLRTYSQIYLVKLNSIANKGENLTDADKADLQTSFNQAVNSAEMAVASNPSNYLNYQLLGSVYQVVGSLGVKDSYIKAIAAYQKASELNPLNPGLKLAMANVSFVDGKVKDAKEYAKAALALKGDYLDALITLSQIAKSEGNKNEAISYAQAALALDPTNKDLKTYLDSLGSVSTPASSSSTTDKPKQ